MYVKTRFKFMSKLFLNACRNLRKRARPQIALGILGGMGAWLGTAYRLEFLSEPLSSRGIGGSGHGYNSLLKPAGGSAQSRQIDFHHPRFRFIRAPWAPRAPSVSCRNLRKRECPQITLGILGGVGAWLGTAYRLEFLGEPVHPPPQS